MKIYFAPISKDSSIYVDRPQPAFNSLPDWYKHIPAFENNKFELDETINTNSTVKMCVPFADTLKFGYIQKTWQDIKIDKVNESHFKYFYPTDPQILKVRNQTHLPKNFFDGYYHTELIWQMQWLPKLPKGYSALITHPLNRQDLPFTTLTGIVDADDYFHNKEGNLPFLLKSNFDGVIPAGTPMYQIIPFKRDDWVSEAEEYDERKKYNGKKIKGTFYGGYKKLIWKKKKFK